MNVTRRHFVAIAGLAAVLPPSLAFASKAPTDRDMVLDDPDAPVLCNPKGDVTVVEYFDYQCPYCKKSYEMVREVVEKDGKVITTRTHVSGQVGNVFKATGIALPANISELPPRT